METSAGVLGLPSADFQRFIVNHGSRIKTIIHGSQVNKSLESGTGLPLCEYSAVELILASSADHGFNVSVSGIEGNQAYLRLCQVVGIFRP